MKTLNDKRISWIDMAKGYGTLLVIYSHLGVGPLWTWIYSFHLPLFFFLSGYVFSTKYDFKTFLKKKCVSIVVPYFCLGIAMVLFEILKQLVKGVFSTESVKDLLQHFVLQQRLWTLWFMACLFFLNILFYLLVKVCKREWMVIALSMILPLIGLYYYKQGGTPLYWNADVCVMAIPFFSLGYFYKLNNEKVDAFFQKKWLSVFLFVFLGIVNILSWRLSLDETGLGLEMFASNYGNPIFTYIAAFAGIFCVVIFSKWFVIEPIRYIGENSMIYYAWHQTIMIPIMTKVMSVVGLISLQGYGLLGTFLYKIVMVIGIVLVLTVCNWVIKRLRLEFMVGK